MWLMEPSTPPPLKADVAPRIYVLDGYLPSRQWPEIESAWQAVLANCESISRWSDPAATPRTLALEHWLCDQLGWQPVALDGLSCWQLDAHESDRTRLTDPAWATPHGLLLTPCHFYVRLDHVGVSSLKDRDLSQLEANALLASLNDDLASWSTWFGSNITLVSLDPMHWLLSTDTGKLDLQGCALAMAEGLNVEQYLAQGSAAKIWRRVLNEIQMIWYEHPVNAARAQEGLLPVNALWLGGALRPGPQIVKRRFRLKGQKDYVKGLERYTHKSEDQQPCELVIMSLEADQLRPEIVHHGLQTLQSAISTAPAEQAFELLVCSDHAWEHYRVVSDQRALNKERLHHRLMRWLGGK